MLMLPSWSSVTGEPKGLCPAAQTSICPDFPERLFPQCEAAVQSGRRCGREEIIQNDALSLFLSLCHYIPVTHAGRLDGRHDIPTLKASISTAQDSAQARLR